MDVLKQRLQSGKESTKSAASLIKTIWKEEGHRGLWRGYLFSLVQFGPYVTIYWVSAAVLSLPAQSWRDSASDFSAHHVFHGGLLRFHPVDIRSTQDEVHSQLCSSGNAKSRIILVFVAAQTT